MNKNAQKVLKINCPILTARGDCAADPSGPTIEIPLVPGEQIVRSPSLSIGRFGGQEQATAQASVWVKYYPNDDAIQIYADDYHSPDSAKITLFDENGAVLRTVHAWETHGGPLAESARFLNEQIAAGAKEAGLIVVRKTPITEEMKRYDFPLLYKDGYLSGVAHPGEEYGENCEIHMVSSVYDGLADFALDQFFCNVIGSTGDTISINHLQTSWINAWIHFTEYDGALPPPCSSLGTGCPVGTNQWINFNCTGQIVGGHVLREQNPRRIARGDYNQRNLIFIVPICNRHNSNNNIYMKAVAGVRAMAITNYFFRDGR